MEVRTAAYEIGEEVVVRLAHAEVFDPQLGAPQRSRHVPPWMIARVIHCEERRGGMRYVLSYRYRHAAYLCSVDEGEIEGTA